MLVTSHHPSGRGADAQAEATHDPSASRVPPESRASSARSASLRAHGAQPLLCLSSSHAFRGGRRNLSIPKRHGRDSGLMAVSRSRSHLRCAGGGDGGPGLVGGRWSLARCLPSFPGCLLSVWKHGRQPQALDTVSRRTPHFSPAPPQPSNDSRKFHGPPQSDKSAPNHAPFSESGSLAQLEERRSHTFV